MKCPACNYERDYDYVNNKPTGDEEFIHIKSTFVIDKETRYSRHQVVYLYACPKCKCVVLRDY